jgi:hypothetical protein
MFGCRPQITARIAQTRSGPRVFAAQDVYMAACRAARARDVEHTLGRIRRVNLLGASTTTDPRPPLCPAGEDAHNMGSFMRSFLSFAEERSLLSFAEESKWDEFNAMLDRREGEVKSAARCDPHCTTPASALNTRARRAATPTPLHLRLRSERASRAGNPTRHALSVLQPPPSRHRLARHPSTHLAPTPPHAYRPFTQLSQFLLPPSLLAMTLHLQLLSSAFFQLYAQVHP